MKNLNIISTLILLLFSIACFSQDVVYVDQNASGANNGSSWENAYLTRIIHAQQF